MKKYSAGMNAHSVWFEEFTIYLSLLLEGRTHEEIKKLSIEDNIFLASSDRRAGQIYGVMRRRAVSLSDVTIQEYLSLTTPEKKLVNVISIMKTEDIFLDYMQEVYYEKLQQGKEKITSYDTKLFFEVKSSQSEKVARWTEETVRRLIRTFNLIITSSGLAKEEQDDLIITTPIMAQSFRTAFPVEDMPYLILLGGNR